MAYPVKTMGGTASAPSNIIQPPTTAINNSANVLQADVGLGVQHWANEDQLLKTLSGNTPIFQYFNPLLATQNAGELALVNQDQANKNENVMLPGMTDARKNTAKNEAVATSPADLKAAVDQWTKQTGLASLLGSGTDPTKSPFALSGFADKGTEQYMNLQDRQLKIGQGLPAQASAGVNPGALLSQQQAVADANSNASAAQQQQVTNAALTQSQGMGNWINSVMGSVMSQNNVANQDWQNYEQAMQTGATNNAASQNAASGATTSGLYTGLGSLAGGLVGSLGGPVGTMAGGALGGMAGKFLGGLVGPNTNSNTDANFT